MLRTLLGAFIVAHGLVTVAIWSPNPRSIQPAPPMNTSHSWLLGEARSVALALALTAGLSIAIAGFGFLTHAAWWPPAAIVSGALSLALFGLFFTPWWLAGIAISTGLIIGALRATTV